MIQRKITINLPESVEILRKLLKILLQFGVISEKEALTIEQETENRPVKKSRWALAAEEMSKENFLGDGLGEELREYMHEFREGFAFKDSFDSKEG